MTEYNKVMTLKEMMDEKSPYDDITYHVDKKFITIKKKKKEIYNIEKNRLSTEKQRLEWVANMSEKRWCYGYKFYQTMLKAIDTMDLK